VFELEEGMVRGSQKWSEKLREAGGWCLFYKGFVRYAVRYEVMRTRPVCSLDDVTNEKRRKQLGNGEYLFVGM
jgi:hypothetical protein